MDTKSLRRHAAGLVVAFGVQFVAGMVLNLFVTIPAQHPGTSGSEYFTRSGHSLLWAFTSGGAALAVHAYIALALLLGCLALWVRALRIHSRAWSWAGGLATVFTLGATFNGLSFLDYSYDASSMVMASFWLLAVGTLVAALAKAPRPTTTLQ